MATTTERGLGNEHQRRKRLLMAQLLRSGPRPCRRCGHLMYHPQQCEAVHVESQRCRWCRLDLGHPDHAPRALGGVSSTEDDLEHAHCNRGAGARLGAALRVRASHSPRW